MASLKIFRKASLTKHYFAPGVNLTMLTSDDYSNTSFAEKYSKIMAQCKEACPDNDCAYVATSTTTAAIKFQDLGFSIALPNQASFTIHYEIKIIFLDTLNFIGSSLGLWFGFSIFGINPFRRMRSGGYEDGNVEAKSFCTSQKTY